MADTEDERRLVAITELVGRTGATSFGIRYSDEDQPVVWLAVATYAGGRAEAAAAMTPGEACWRLGGLLIDGGTCTHCGKRTALLTPAEDGMLEAHGLGGCQWTLRGDRVVRGCE